MVLEARAPGLPVIVSDEGGPEENILPGETGLAVPAAEENLNRTILGLAADLSRPEKKMGRAARRYAEKRTLSEAFLASRELDCHL